MNNTYLEITPNLLINKYKFSVYIIADTIVVLDETDLSDTVSKCRICVPEIYKCKKCKKLDNNNKESVKDSPVVKRQRII